MWQLPLRGHMVNVAWLALALLGWTPCLLLASCPLRFQVKPAGWAGALVGPQKQLWTPPRVHLQHHPHPPETPGHHTCHLSQPPGGRTPQKASLQHAELGLRTDSASCQDAGTSPDLGLQAHLWAGLQSWQGLGRPHGHRGCPSAHSCSAHRGCRQRGRGRVLDHIPRTYTVGSPGSQHEESDFKSSCPASCKATGCLPGALALRQKSSPISAEHHC